MANIIAPPKKATEGSKKEDWAKVWEKLSPFSILLMRNYPIAGMALNILFNKFATNNPLCTDEEKCKETLATMASFYVKYKDDPAFREAIQKAIALLPQQPEATPTTDLQTRMQTVTQTLSPTGDLITTTPKTMLFGALQRQHTPLTALVAERPSIEHVKAEEQATRKLWSHP